MLPIESQKKEYNVFSCTQREIWNGRYGFSSFARKYQKQLLDKGLDASKKVVHKAGEYLGNKIADAVTKSNDDNIAKQESVEEIIIPPEKRKEI